MLGARAFKQPLLFIMCAILALFEGMDLASMGLAMSRLTADLDLGPARGGLAASMTMLGFAIGAPIGGRLADRLGMRPVLLLTISLVAVGSLLTAMSWSFSSLLAARLAAGLGLGGLMPALVTMARGAAEPAFRARAVGMLLACGSVGSIGASVLSLHSDWRMLFYIGGLGPLMLFLSTAGIFRNRVGDINRPDEGPRPAAFQALFANRNAPATLMLWSLSFATVLSTYAMVNWLPSLLSLRGLSPSEVVTTMVGSSCGGILGNLVIGWLIDKSGDRIGYLVAYTGALACMIGLSLVAWPPATVPLALLMNFSLLGAQLVSTTIAPKLYPPPNEATGLGAMVAAGRLGAVCGPLVVGQILAAGYPASRVFLLALPPLATAFLLAMLLCSWMKGKSRTEMCGQPAPAN